ncbi:hypothetical protein RclHR1_05430003 [Rhizophagus clarus]|uniref:Uncharacterized protein n=1 Tax=Rhizophagus clarus TaxID=94130 RepID=A0A2Z6RSZ7_9GLOM|nr:hypothetical protein RclHR1_05430003 [Rhizophagus clarus]
MVHRHAIRNGSLRQRIAELEAENAEIPELRKKVVEVETENMKLKWIMADLENTEFKTRVEELERYNSELKIRVAKLILTKWFS